MINARKGQMSPRSFQPDSPHELETHEWTAYSTSFSVQLLEVCGDELALSLHTILPFHSPHATFSLTAGKGGYGLIKRRSEQTVKRAI